PSGTSRRPSRSWCATAPPSSSPTACPPWSRPIGSSCSMQARSPRVARTCNCWRTAACTRSCTACSSRPDGLGGDAAAPHGSLVSRARAPLAPHAAGLVVWRTDACAPPAVQSTCAWRQVGAEPLITARRSACPTIVARDRVAGARALVAGGADVVLADDGLQHLRLGRDCEIVVIDGARGFDHHDLAI